MSEPGTWSRLLIELKCKNSQQTKKRIENLASKKTIVKTPCLQQTVLPIYIFISPTPSPITLSLSDDVPIFKKRSASIDSRCCCCKDRNSSFLVYKF